jgi:hypothetical protein
MFNHVLPLIFEHLGARGNLLNRNKKPLLKTIAASLIGAHPPAFFCANVLKKPEETLPPSTNT